MRIILRLMCKDVLHWRRMSAQPEPPTEKPQLFYCPACAIEVTDPLTCGDCLAIICRRCGTPLESPDELAMG